MTSEAQERQLAEHVVGRVDEIQPGQHKIVHVRDSDVGIYNVDGEYHALLNVCPHQLGPVCAGPVGGEMICRRSTDWHFQWQRGGEVLTCPWHGMEFDIRTGKSLSHPRMRVRRLPLKIVDNEIRVQFGSRPAN